MLSIPSVYMPVREHVHSTFWAACGVHLQCTHSTNGGPGTAVYASTTSLKAHMLTLLVRSCIVARRALIEPVTEAGLPMLLTCHVLLCCCLLLMVVFCLEREQFFGACAAQHQRMLPGLVTASCFIVHLLHNVCVNPCFLYHVCAKQNAPACIPHQVSKVVCCWTCII